MKKQIEDIKQFVVDRFKPQGIEIDLDYGTTGDYKISMCLTPRESKDRLNMEWGRTLLILRETFINASFYNVSEYVYPDNFLSEQIIFTLN